MTSVSIAPAVALAEADALIAHLRQRGLIQAQAIADLQARIAELEANIPPATEEVTRG